MRKKTWNGRSIVTLAGLVLAGVALADYGCTWGWHPTGCSGEIPCPPGSSSGSLYRTYTDCNMQQEPAPSYQWWCCSCQTKEYNCSGSSQKKKVYSQQQPVLADCNPYGNLGHTQCSFI